MSFLQRLLMYGLVVVGLGLLILPVSPGSRDPRAPYGIEIDAVEATAAAPMLPVRVGGGLLLVLAVAVMHRLYRSRRGQWLNVAATGKAALFDGLGLAVAAILCAGVPARIIERTTGAGNPLHGMGDTDLIFVAGVIGLVLGAPIMSLMASLLAPSWVAVDGDGVRQQGMILRTRLGWPELKEISIETRTLHGRDHWGNPTDRGSVDFKVLELRSDTAVVALLVPKPKTRAEITRRLLEYVPEWHRENLEAHLREWR